eukprot:5613114-Pyramimonas_sp.AAC.1
MFGVSVVRWGECMSALPARAGHPRPPEGRLMLDPSGRRKIVGSPKSNPRTFVTRADDEKGSRFTESMSRAI